jgi:biopolymer transport protein ExbD
MQRDRKRHAGYRQFVEADLDIMPLMNLFVVLIPMLLLSAVFVNLAVVDMHLPPSDAALEASRQAQLELAVTIDGTRYTVESKRTKRRVIERDDPEVADEELGNVLRAIAQKHPDNEEIMLVSQGNTPYQELIRLMDISRESGMPAISLVGASR